MSTSSKTMPVMAQTDWGIDRIAFTYPVDESQSDAVSNLWSGSSTHLLPETDMESICHRGQITVGHATVDVRLYSLRNRCRVEFNPSRILTPKGRDLCLPELIGPLVELVVDQIRHAAWPAFDTVTADGEIIRQAGWERQILIKRLDLARNFEISNPGPVKIALEHKIPKYQKQRSRHSGSSGGWTITNTAPKSGRDIFYDKTADLSRVEDLQIDQIAVHDRIFRFETKLMDPRLRAGHLRTLAGLTVEACWLALAARWKATEWGTPIAVGGDLYRLVSDLPFAERAGLVGYLMLKSAGADAGISKSQERRLSKAARMLGLTVGVPLEVQGEPDAHLNLTSGRLEPWTQPRRQPKPKFGDQASTASVGNVVIVEEDIA